MGISDGEDEAEDLEQLTKAAEEDIPEDIKEGKHREAETCEDESIKEGEPKLWVKELVMKEQPDVYDSVEDPEYIPPTVDEEKKEKVESELVKEEAEEAEEVVCW